MPGFDDWFSPVIMRAKLTVEGAGPMARITKEMGVWVFVGEETEPSIPDWRDQERIDEFLR